MAGSNRAATATVSRRAMPSDSARCSSVSRPIAGAARKSASSRRRAESVGDGRSMPGEAVESRMHPRHSSMALMPPKPCSALYYRSLSRARPPREAEPEQDLEQRAQRQYREHQRRKAEQRSEERRGG